MPVSRRSALRSLAFTSAGLGVLGVAGGVLLDRDPGLFFRGGRLISSGGSGTGRPTGFVKLENQLPGSDAWKMGDRGTRPADDVGLQVKGFPSATSAIPGESLTFFITVAKPEAYVVDIYRLGWYGGKGARRVTASPALDGRRQPWPDVDRATGMITCPWAPSWHVEISDEWTPGAYIAVFTTASGWRNYTPFVVHDPATSGGLCVVLPFTTYQAYNQFPLDGHTGKSLYYGYAPKASARTPETPEAPADPVAATATGSIPDAQPTQSWARAHQVSFDRPYMQSGLPKRFDEDHYFIQWAEQQGYDLNYASSIDLESGRLDPARHSAMIFCGHDEYWSRTMRTRIATANATGTHLAYLAANNVYWHIRFDASAAGVPNRIVVCHKDGTDLHTPGGDLTRRWRDPSPAPADPEQRLLGVQYNGIVKQSGPLLVQRADHWMWAGAGVRDGTPIRLIVGGEADGYDPVEPSPAGGEQVLLSASPYALRDGGAAIQNTGLHIGDNGAMVFVAGTLNWTKGLASAKLRDPRIGRVTRNLFDRMQG